MSWTREKFLKILEFLTTDLLGGDTNTPQDSLSDCGLADDCLKTGNGTIVGILEVNFIYLNFRILILLFSEITTQNNRCT